MLHHFKKIKNRLLRVAAIVFCSALLFVIVVIAFVSPIAKYLIEKNSEKYTGRKVKMSWLYLNPFTGGVVARNLIVCEKGSSDTAMLVGTLSANITLGKLFYKTYELSSVTFDHVLLNVIQDSTKFNFDDLLHTDSTRKNDTVHFRICNIQIANSEVHYKERTIPVTYFIKNVNVKCTSLQWDVDSTYVEYAFDSGSGSGLVKGNVGFNMKSTRYNLQTTISNFDLRVLEQYIKDFSSYGSFIAYMDADIHSIGDLHSKLNSMTKGKMSIRDFHFGITAMDDYASFKTFSMNIDSLYPADKKYFLSSLLLDSAYLKYEKYDYLDNFSRMFGVNASKVKEAYAKHQEVNIIFLIADYLSELARNLINSQYRVDDLTIKNSSLLFNDYSLLEKFSATTDSIGITAVDIDSRKKRSYLTLKSSLIPFGNVDVKLDVNPTDFGDFHMVYDLKNVPLPVFNPYLITYSSFPFHKGSMQVNGTWDVVNKQISSVNHLIIVNPTTADKIRKGGTHHLPIPLLLDFVRSWHRTIDIEVPITGDLSNPTYHLRDVIFDVISNIFVKPVTLPYTISIQQQKAEAEEHEMMEWKPMQSQIDHDQKRQLKKISNYLVLNPQVLLTISPTYFEQHEKEMILLFEAKKKFYGTSHDLAESKLTEDDSAAISSLSIKDSDFVHFLNRTVDPNGSVFSVLGKCELLVGKDEVNKKYNELVASRKREIMNLFADHKQASRISYRSPINVTPPSGYSHDVFRYQ